MDIQDTVLSSLMHNEDYVRTVVPFIKEDYFSHRPQKVVFGMIKEFFTKHNALPTKNILNIELEGTKGLSQAEFDACTQLIDGLSPTEDNHDWLVERTEKFCKDQAVYNAIMEAITRIENDNKDSIPQLLQDALAVSFDNSVGHEYFDNAADRFDFYHTKEERVPSGIEIFDKVTRGGLPKKSLSALMATTGGGKSLFMTNYASNVIRAGGNVLYITLELSEEKVSERIDCNLLDVTIDDLYKLGKDEFVGNVSQLKAKTRGKLIVKEYPTGGAHAGHFKALLEELKIKKNFFPDIIFVDYLNICASSRLKSGMHNSYTVIKAIAEELRGMAIEYNVPVLTCTQTNREGMTNSDMDMTNTSESIGLPQTLDFFGALIANEELDDLGQIMFKVLKNRWNDPNYYKRFMIGIERAKFMLYDVDPTEGLTDTGRTDEKDDDVPLFDRSPAGKRLKGSVDDIVFE